MKKSIPTILSTFLAAMLLSATPPADGAQGTTYYISAAGNDSAKGTSPKNAWRTLDKVSKANLRPGDKVLLKAGDTFSGELILTHSGTSAANITISKYGQGSHPAITGKCATISGNHVTISRLKFDKCNLVGLTITGDNNTITNNVMSRNAVGTEVLATAKNTLVEKNKFLNNNKMVVNTPGGNDDYGANGVIVWGDKTVVLNNFFKGHVAKSEDYKFDGAAVEIYSAQNTLIKNNKSVNNLTFTELGSDVPNKRYTTGTVYDKNYVTSTLKASQFLITRGGGTFGPVYGTVAKNNTAILVGKAATSGVYCGPGCEKNILSMENNTIIAPGPAQVEGDMFSSENNRWCGEYHDLYTAHQSDVVKTITVRGKEVKASLNACKN